MKKIAVIYWSGTGNTEQMAKALAAGAEGPDAEVKVLSVDDATVDDAIQADALALGCPAMGNEVLEEGSMEPFVESLEGQKNGIPIVLFGSYDWGSGEWMKEWEERMRNQGFTLLEDGLIIQNTPDEEGLAACRALGKKLAAAVV
ncbi:hypothetical protein P22_0706 [Propionispora sp. 2/2-37]|uniref:flavodoxin n=1 Tax=Propionispora sp. 2/2-37 TaxID=1677858 RepID=UPI0006BB8AAC|nr:flavodoxin [Propionispora sp. 2/2-37]CUH94640.1 hypothetical protein P22_0706 [Propionispora sp. 2/2-37]